MEFAMSKIDAVMAALTDHEEAGIAQMIEWFSIPSVGTDPAHKQDTRDAAQWCVDRLNEAGIDAQLRETGTPDKRGAPIVWAQHAGSSDYAGPHVLFYGHYDVQPADPLDLWESPPFEPVRLKAEPGGAGERLVARGSADDKGQVMTFIEALRAWKTAAGEVPIRMTILIEGEEESGSVNLEQFLLDNAADLKKADIALISDTGMPSATQPAITYGMRGLAYTEVRLHGPNQDLHSGNWGGRAPNPNNELVKVLAQLWDENRKVTIPGFYDDVLELTDGERSAWKKLGFDQIAALKKIGLGPKADVGETGYSPIEREWARPTAEINGIYGGYIGAGAKTVIPAYATAKVSFRLVADQCPTKIRDSFFAWLEERTPPGCRWEMSDHGGGPPGNVPSESPFLQAAADALRDAAGGTEPVLIKSGGSIPVVGLLHDKIGIDTILMGFSLDDDRIHSPNEKFELDCWRLGGRAHARLIDAFCSMK
jgi:acetylornithine deacetylase/succinyl-diaminopimelate desuccinylase-like protein